MVPTTPFAAAGYMVTAANPLEAALGRLNPNRGRQQTQRIDSNTFLDIYMRRPAVILSVY